MIEPELITIIEGPAPDFRPNTNFFFPSIMEGPEGTETFLCDLRTMNGPAILDRCQEAWKEGRPVQLVYKDDMLMEQSADVSAMRLEETDEGTVLKLWIRAFVEFEIEEVDEGEGDDGLDTLDF